MKHLLTTVILAFIALNSQAQCDPDHTFYPAATACGQTVKRDSEKAWIKSWCSKADKWVRIIKRKSN